jgi:hypothetical protein
MISNHLEGALAQTLSEREGVGGSEAARERGGKGGEGGGRLGPFAWLPGHCPDLEAKVAANPVNLRGHPGSWNMDYQFDDHVPDIRNMHGKGNLLLLLIIM